MDQLFFEEHHADFIKTTRKRVEFDPFTDFWMDDLKAGEDSTREHFSVPAFFKYKFEKTNGVYIPVYVAANDFIEHLVGKETGAAAMVNAIILESLFRQNELAGEDFLRKRLLLIEEMWNYFMFRRNMNDKGRNLIEKYCENAGLVYQGLPDFFRYEIIQHAEEKTKKELGVLTLAA